VVQADSGAIKINTMNVQIVDSLDRIPAEDWNALVGSQNPFLRHEFLSGLERTGCVRPETGWLPQHLVIHDSTHKTGRLLGAVPMYLKNHSFGEYVFDWAWANAFTQAGGQYYPKLVVGVPFTPVTGPRILVPTQSDDPDATKRLLVSTALQVMADRDASSLHWLFLSPEDTDLLGADQHLLRTGFQFHWANRAYQDFDHFLAGLTADKRKKIRRERRHVREAGIEMEVLGGHQLSDEHWRQFYEFYLSTIHAHGSHAYLTYEFFQHLGHSMPEQVVLVLARKGRDVVAGALNLRGCDTLYGRYWGCREEYHSLHFETCYYSAMEYCIREHLDRFEAGAQGAHKLARGFTPVITRSAHRLAHPQLNRAVAEYLARERQDIDHHVSELNEHAPFRRTATTGG